MKRTWTLLAVLLTTGIALAAAAPAALARGVNDEGKFFSEAAEAKAKSQIEQIFDKHHGKEVQVDTLDALPPGQDLRAVTTQRASGSRNNGIYIVIVRKGGMVGVLPDASMRKLFTDDVSRELREKITRDLQQGPQNFDTALLNAVGFINDKMDQTDRPSAGSGGGAPLPAPRTGPTNSGSGGGYTPPAGPTRRTGPTGCGLLPGGLMGWICLIGGAWLIFGLVRGMFRGRGGYGGGGYAPGPGGGYGGGPVGPGYGGYGGGGYGGGYGGGGFGGGGWGSSILGGLFGAAAGNWMYDRFARGGGSAYGQSPPVDPGVYGGGAAAGGSAPSEPNWAPASGDYSGGGGSFSDSPGADFGGGGGGGDFGGGGGGGDFGGGGGGFSDSGGGGDFGGGGGGDFGGGGGDFA